MIIKKSTPEILAESLKELLEKKALEKITIQNITENCQLTRSTFYRYFKDKYELMNWIYTNEIDTFLRANPDISSWKDLLTTVTQFLKKNQPFFSTIIEFKGQNSFEDFLYTYSSSYCINHILNCSEKKQLSSTESIAISIYIGGTMKALFNWIKSGCKESPEEMSKIMSECMPHPLAKYFKNEL